jgi:hypothetical protein
LTGNTYKRIPTLAAVATYQLIFSELQQKYLACSVLLLPSENGELPLEAKVWTGSNSLFYVYVQRWQQQ